MRLTSTWFVFILLLLCQLTACGRTGNLYLPPDEKNYQPWMTDVIHHGQHHPLTHPNPHSEPHPAAIPGEHLDTHPAAVSDPNSIPGANPVPNSLPDPSDNVEPQAGQDLNE